MKRCILGLFFILLLTKALYSFSYESEKILILGKQLEKNLQSVNLAEYV